MGPRRPLPQRPRGARRAVQLEGGPRGVHRELPHGGRPSPAAQDERRHPDPVRRVRGCPPREPHDHAGGDRQRARGTTWGSRTSSTPCSSPRTTPTPWSPRAAPPGRCWPSAPAGSWPERTGGDYSAITDCEALDAIEYFVFPNFVPWAGYTTPLVYRFRPHGDDHRAAVMDVMLLEPVPAAGPRPPAAPTRHLEPGERWADAPELGYLGRILDQDTATLARVQHGLAGRRRSRRDPGAVTRRAASATSTPPSASTWGTDGGRRRPTPQSVWVADDTEPVLDTTVACILRDAARRSPDTVALVAGTADPALAPALDLRRAPGRRRHARRGRWRRGSSRPSAWRCVAPEPPRVARPHLRRRSGRSGARAREPRPAERGAAARARPIGQRPASSSCPSTAATTWPPRSPRCGPTSPRCARWCPSTTGTRSVPRHRQTRHRRTRHRTPPIWPTGCRRPTTWPSSSTPRGPRGRRRGRCSPTGA